MRRRHEQEGANGIEGQADDDRLLVADAANDHRCGQRRAEIADIEGELGQASLGAGEVQRLLEMMQQQVIELRSQAPGEEQGRGQGEGDKIASFDDRQLHGVPPRFLLSAS